MTNAELEVVKKETRDAMRRASEVTRDACAEFVREFGGRVSNDALLAMIESLPLLCEASRSPSPRTE